MNQLFKVIIIDINQIDWVPVSGTENNNNNYRWYSVEATNIHRYMYYSQFDKLNCIDFHSVYYNEPTPLFQDNF